MAHPFDPGPVAEPYASLCRAYPGPEVYAPEDFRLEWGPVFHRGRLDGSARVVVIGQDPAQHETIARRILVGEAGHRLQGFLAKLGITRSYVMINTFLYSVFGQGRGERHRDDAKIAAYRHKWLNALLVGQQVEAVIALGSLAESAWLRWKTTTKGKTVDPDFIRITHPTQPEAAGGRTPGGHSAAIARMLENWNAGLQALHPLSKPDKSGALKLYGQAFQQDDQIPIPEEDLPAGMPAWMCLDDGWAERTGAGRKKRATITVTVPTKYLP